MTHDYPDLSASLFTYHTYILPDTYLWWRILYHINSICTYEVRRTLEQKAVTDAIYNMWPIISLIAAMCYVPRSNCVAFRKPRALDN